jgi:hypothetical protein
MDASTIALIKTGIGGSLLVLWVVLEYIPPKTGSADDVKGFLKTVLIALAGHLTGSGA